MNARPDWDTYFLGIAYAVAQRADCTRRLAGAVIVDAHNRIVSTGYNGAPSGLPGCLTAGACPRGQLNEVPPGSSYEAPAGKCEAVHAEANALLHGDATRYKGGTLYLVCLNPDGSVHPHQEPCQSCSVLIRGGGIARTVTLASLMVALPPAAGVVVPSVLADTE